MQSHIHDQSWDRRVIRTALAVAIATAAVVICVRDTQPTALALHGPYGLSVVDSTHSAGPDNTTWP